MRTRQRTPSPDDIETARKRANEDRSNDGLWLVVSASSGMTCVPLRDQVAISIGRSPTCDVRVDDDSVSRKHAVLHLQGTPTIEDAGSRNGTTVAGRLLGRGERADASPGSVVQLGSATVLLQRAPHAAESTQRDASSTGAAAEPLVLDPLMQRLYALLDLIAPSPLNVLVLGETGTGKEVFAAEIHARSKRAKRPFLRINCATLSGSLLESELFGYEKGAFTGAATAKMGLFEAAHRGTLFLDEIGEMPIETQAKLLRVLDAGEVMRLGSVSPRKVDVRYVAATNVDLQLRVADGRFRSDLYFRLNGFGVTLPSLRKRHAEVIPLAQLFVDLAARRTGRRAPALSQATRTALLGYGWPGNIRELRSTMERAVVLAGVRRAIEPEHLMLPEPVVPAAGSIDGSLNDYLSAQEKERVLDALRRASGNQTKAAKLLGLSRRSIITKIETFGIDRPRKDKRRA